MMCENPTTVQGLLIQTLPVFDTLPFGGAVATLLNPEELGGAMVPIPCDLEEPAVAFAGPCEWECPATPSP